MILLTRGILEAALQSRGRLIGMACIAAANPSEQIVPFLGSLEADAGSIHVA